MEKFKLRDLVWCKHPTQDEKRWLARIVDFYPTAALVREAESNEGLADVYRFEYITLATQEEIAIYLLEN